MECIADEQAQKEYLGPLDMRLYFNEENFDSANFGEKSINRQSKIVST